MEPSSSWSMARFSRSERRNETISSIISGTLAASERIAPVHGMHPRERMRHFNFWFPLAQRIAKGIDALLCARFFFVTARAAKSGIKLSFVQRVQKRRGLQ